MRFLMITSKLHVAIQYEHVGYGRSIWSTLAIYTVFTVDLINLLLSADAVKYVIVCMPIWLTSIGCTSHISTTVHIPQNALSIVSLVFLLLLALQVEDHSNLFPLILPTWPFYLSNSITKLMFLSCIVIIFCLIMYNLLRAPVFIFHNTSKQYYFYTYYWKYQLQWKQLCG